MIPILFIHKGYDFYMEYTLRQCKYSNPDSTLILLGNQDINLPFVNYHKLDEYASSAVSFEKVYEHFSTNSLSYELFCFQRWFYIYDFMLANQLDEVFVCDSDLMLYKSVADYKEWLEKNDQFAAFCIADQSYDSLHWCGSAHSSYWTLEGIKAFCDYMQNAYINEKATLRLKWDMHIQNNMKGGVCDMTLLYLFFCKHPNKIINLLKITPDKRSFDNNINESHNWSQNEYLVNDKTKSVVIDGKFIKIKNKEGDLIDFYSLHFQGKAKRYIKKYYLGKQDTILVYRKLEDRFKALNRLSTKLSTKYLGLNKSAFVHKIKYYVYGQRTI